MAITILKLQRNHRGCAFEFVGDGATTVLPTITPAQLSAYLRPNTTATVTCISSPTGKYERESSGTTGLTTQRVGTPQACSVAVSPSAGITVTVSPAVGNGVAATCEVVFGNSTD